MDNAVNLPISALLLSGLLLIIPAVATLLLRLGLFRDLMVSTARMVIQLSLIGFFLEYIIETNSTILNICWVGIMIMFASLTTIGKSEIKARRLFIPVFTSLLFSTLFVIFYVNLFVTRTGNIFDARYLIVLSGMLLGNSLRGTIIALSCFYNEINKNEKYFFYLLSLGAEPFEVRKPFLKEALTLALKPTLATMATMGLVALPGMMTGNILGGTNPFLAIKYQIMIMIAIISCVTLCVLLTIFATAKFSFNGYGVLDKSIFKNPK
jgi:putative ABC transport system permease protein